MTNPRVVPADLPAYEVTAEGIMLLAEFGRTVTVQCQKCDHGADFKLIADELIGDDECDRILNDYLHEIGWTRDDVCPDCVHSSGATA